MEDFDKQIENKRKLPDHLWKKGQSGNPNGRPKGKSLKEFARQYLSDLPDDMKLEYISTLPKDIVWKMAEGNPDNKTDVTTDGESLNKVTSEDIALAHEIIKRREQSRDIGTSGEV